MKKLVYLMGLMLAVSACQVRHDHSKQMQSVRVAVDTAQKNYVDEERAKAAAEAAEDEGLTVLPQEPVRGDLTKKSFRSMTDPLYITRAPNSMMES